MKFRVIDIDFLVLLRREHLILREWNELVALLVKHRDIREFLLPLALVLMDVLHTWEELSHRDVLSIVHAADFSQVSVDLLVLNFSDYRTEWLPVHQLLALFKSWRERLPLFASFIIKTH